MQSVFFQFFPKKVAFFVGFSSGFSTKKSWEFQSSIFCVFQLVYGEKWWFWLIIFDKITFADLKMSLFEPKREENVVFWVFGLENRFLGHFLTVLDPFFATFFEEIRAVLSLFPDQGGFRYFLLILADLGIFRCFLSFFVTFRCFIGFSCQLDWNRIFVTFRRFLTIYTRIELDWIGPQNMTFRDFWRLLGPEIDFWTGF